MKRILMAVGGLALVALLGVTVVNGVVNAQTPESETSKRDEYIASLATKLGVSPETLETAIDETSDELGFGPGRFGGWLRERFQQHREDRHDRIVEHLDLTESAAFIGITEDELKSELQDDKTFLEIAQEHGKTTDQVRTFLIERATEAIDTRLNAASDDATTTGA
jgi:hypothetical protein